MSQEMTLSGLMEDEWVPRAAYVCRNRAIPCVIDGMKNVQRMLLYNGLKLCRDSWTKTAGVSGTLAAVGYHHGEGAAEAALQGMASYCRNNLQLFEGDGSFGNRLEPDDCAAGRYTRVKVTPLFDSLFPDCSLLPRDPDPETLSPAVYLPVIPLVLVNGIKGIAVGFASDIPPYSPISLADCMIRLSEGKDPGEPDIQYPLFKGKVIRHDNQHVLEGCCELMTRDRVRVTELPYGISSSGYEAILTKLEAKGKITDWKNLSRKDEFLFEVTFPKGKIPADIHNILKLRRTVSWNLTCVDQDGQLLDFNGKDGIKRILKTFYDFRIGFVSLRLDKEKAALEAEAAYLKSWIRFCSDVVSKKFSFQKAEDDAALGKLLHDGYGFDPDGTRKVSSAPVRSFTREAIRKAESRLDAVESRLDEIAATTPEAEYKSDLMKFKTAFIKYQKTQA